MPGKPNREELERRIEALEKERIEHKTAIDASRARERQFRTVIEQAADAMFIHDLKGRFLDVNRCACESLGYSRDELLGMTVFDVDVKYPTIEHFKDSWDPLNAGERVTLEGLHKRKDGALFPVEVHIGILEVEGDRRSILSLARDITQRKRAEEALKESEIKYRAMMKAIKDTVFICSKDYRIEYMNPAMIKRIGRDAVGELCFEALHEREEICPWCNQGIIQRGKDCQWEVTSPKNGRSFYISSSPVYNIDGTVSKISISRDISKIKRVEEELRRHRNHLEELVAHRTEQLTKSNKTLQLEIEERKQVEVKLRRANEAAVAANAAKSHFLANMSHEFRTPMSTILGMAELLEETELSGEQKEFIESIHSSGDLLISLIDDILDFSRIEKEPMELDPAPFDLLEEVESIAKFMAVQTREKGLTFRCRVAPDIRDHRRLGDSNRLRRILVNLVGNAIKFTREGEVALEAREEPDSPDSNWVRFSVRDTGIGIPPDKREMIFESFTQADSSMTREFGGMGLGLAITRRLVRSMAGRIWLESEPNLGTTFYFVIPLPVAAAYPARTP